MSNWSPEAGDRPTIPANVVSDYNHEAEQMAAFYEVTQDKIDQIVLNHLIESQFRELDQETVDRMTPEEKVYHFSQKALIDERAAKEMPSLGHCFERLFEEAKNCENLVTYTGYGLDEKWEVTVRRVAGKSPDEVIGELRLQLKAVRQKLEDWLWDRTEDQKDGVTSWGHVYPEDLDELALIVRGEKS